MLTGRKCGSWKRKSRKTSGEKKAEEINRKWVCEK